MNTEELTIDQITEQYPDEWVLLGNPLLSGTSIIAGIVLFHSKDKREIAYSDINWRLHFKSAMTVFTGKKTTNHKFWL